MQKTQILEILDGLPDDVDVDAFLEEVLLREKLEAGEADVAADRVVPHDEAKKRLGQFLAK